MRKQVMKLEGVNGGGGQRVQTRPADPPTTWRPPAVKTASRVHDVGCVATKQQKIYSSQCDAERRGKKMTLLMFYRSITCAEVKDKLLLAC